MKVYVLFSGYVNYEGDFVASFEKLSSSSKKLKEYALEALEQSEKMYRDIKERYSLDPEKYYYDERVLRRYESSKTDYKRFYNYDEEILNMESVSGPEYPGIFYIKEFNLTEE